MAGHVNLVQATPRLLRLDVGCAMACRCQNKQTVTREYLLHNHRGIAKVGVCPGMQLLTCAWSFIARFDPRQREIEV